jgi:hypothetical protein
MSGRVTGIRVGQSDDAAGMSFCSSYVVPTERPFKIFLPLSKLHSRLPLGIESEAAAEVGFEQQRLQRAILSLGGDERQTSTLWFIEGS